MAVKFFNLELDAIFCLNLKKRTDRRAYCEALFAELGWEVTFIEATKGKHRDKLFTAGMIGCFQSHAGIFRMAQEQGINRYLVFEDDVALIQGAEFLLQNGTKQIPADADFLYFGFEQDNGIMGFRSKANDYWVRPGAGWGCHAYAVLNPKTTNLLVEGTKVMRMEIDRQLIHLVLPLYDINHYMQLPPPIIQKNMGTNVQTHRKNEPTGIH